MSVKRQTRPPADDNLEFIFPDVVAGDDAARAFDSSMVDDCGVSDDIDAPHESGTATPDDVDAEPAPDDEERDVTEAVLDAEAIARAEPRFAGPEFDALADVTTAEDEDERGEDIAADVLDTEFGQRFARDAVAHDPAEDPEDDDDFGSTDEWAQELEALEVSEPAHAPRVLHVEDVMARSYGFTTIARSLLAIIALHALLAFSIRLAPSYARAWLARLPLAGALLAREPRLMQRVELRNVAGTYQELRNARRVFVITGEAVNRSPASVERIEVEGTLYDGDGHVERKVVSAGNRTRLRDLSEKEIALLQRLDPRRIVAPGESSTFLIVFLEPPRTVVEFSSRVSNVRPTRRLARPWTEHPAGSSPNSPSPVG